MQGFTHPVELLVTNGAVLTHGVKSCPHLLSALLLVRMTELKTGLELEFILCLCYTSMREKL